MKKLSIGDVVTGEIIYLNNEYIFVDLNQKMDGILPVKSLTPEYQNRQLKVGDQVTANISKFTSEGIELSQVINKKSVEDEDIRNAFEQEIPVKGKIKDVVKGGVRVNIMGKTGFCPISQVDMYYCEDPGVFINTDSFFVIMEYEKSTNTLVVSRKEYLLKEQLAGWKQLAGEWNANTDKIYKGKVERIIDHGILIKIKEGLVGYLPESEISFTNASKMKENFSIGQELEVIILKINLVPEKPGALLSVKKLKSANFSDIMDQYPVGKIVQGQIIRMVKGGMIVELEDNLAGFLPNSELSRQNHLSTKELQLNCLLDVHVKDVDPIKKQIILTVQSASTESNWQQYTGGKSQSGFKPFGNLLKKES